MRSIDDLTCWIDARGGIAHSSEAKDAGFTVHGIRSAIAAGGVRWARRSWLVAADADPDVAAAASRGARLTCVTAAARAGLWVPSHDDTHLVVPPSRSRLDLHGVRLHWSRGPLLVPTGQATDPIINVLFHVSRCVPPADALAVWESALRLKKVDAAVLAGIRWGSPLARAFAQAASDLSDSGLETRFMLLMRGLGVTVQQQVFIDGHAVDALVGERLVVQLDGFAHHQARERRRDLRADARLALRGFTVLRFDYLQVMCDPTYIVDTVAAALAQGLHRRRFAS